MSIGSDQAAIVITIVSKSVATPQGDMNHDQRIRAALVDLLYRQSYGVMFASVIVPWPVSYALWHAVPHGRLLTWAGALYVVTGARWLLSHSYFHRKDDRTRPEVWANRFMPLSLLLSLLWGAFGWIGFTPDHPHFIAFTAIVLVTMAAGGLWSLAAYPAAYTRMLIVVHVPFALRCLMQDDPIYSFYLVLQACLFAVSLYFCRITYRSLKETISLRFENMALAEKLEHERDQATAADRAKTRFLAAASHDLRQPLHALGLFAATLAALARKGDVSAAEAQNLAGKLQAVIGSLGGLLHGLIDVSRLDAGLVPVECQPISLARLISGLREEFNTQARERGIDLRAVACAAWVESDPALLKRILDNFLSNALRYALGGRVLVGCRRRGDTIEIQVVDTGPGIPADQHEAVFEEFMQLHNPHRNREQGLGLGLAIVRRLAALLGNPVTLRSTPGKGSTFAVRVPLATTPTIVPSASPKHNADGALGIMVLDDDSQVLESIVQLLTAWGHSPYAAANVDELCRHHEESGAPSVHLIIADYRLAGGLTGSEAIERLVAHLGYRVPALIVTGDTSPERLRELTASGHVLLHKPLAPDLLQTAICQVIA